ncbi:hypothetical protein JCM19236_930 [Vibrio sp. JCM 19236]|nr:hypothetical protein JCM19236_930 [Vibrio sp. JCM 19236]
MMNAQTATMDLEVSKTPLVLKVLVVLAMMTLMGGTLTGVMTYFNLGYSESFFQDWFSSFTTVAMTVMPIGFVLMASLTKLAERLFSNVSEHARNLVIGVIMAGIMESGMAFATAMNNIGFDDKELFIDAWLNGLIGALPVALVLMITVNMTIKPKVEKFLKS